jgi:hypothetical protein
MSTDGARNGIVRRLHEVLFSGTIASAFLTGLIGSGSNYWTGQFFGWEMGLNHSFHRMYNDHLGKTLAFCIWSLALTAVGFLLLRALSRAELAAGILRTFAGVLVAAVPPACLWLVTYHGTLDAEWGWWWLRFEACAGIGCALLYACNLWPLWRWTTVTLVTLHYALWFDAYSGAFGYQGACWQSVPIVGYLSNMTWVYCVGRYRNELSAQRESTSFAG